MKNTNEPDHKALALELAQKLHQAGAISLHAGDKSYVTCDEEIADESSRRELEAMLIRLGIFKPTDHLTKALAARLESALILQGIHLNQWLADRKYQSELDELDRLLADYSTHGDLDVNDTRLRIAVLNIAKAHASELRATAGKNPPDTSIHIVRIIKTHPEYLAAR